MNIFLIQGKRDGCLLYYYHEKSHQNEVKTKHFSCSATHLMKSVCQNFETDFDGNRKAIKKNHKFIQKTPVLIIRNHSLFFPTCSIESTLCSWINYYCVSDYVASKNQIKVEFSMQSSFRDKITHPNHREMILKEDVWIECSFRVFKKQMQRCTVIDHFAREKLFTLDL